MREAPRSILWSFCPPGHLAVQRSPNVSFMPSKLTALVLSQDRAAVVPLKTVFGISGVAFDIHTEEIAVTKALSQNHFDGIVLDCDHEAGLKLIDQVGKGRSNKLSPLFTLTSSMDTVDQSRQNDVNLVLHKPLTVVRITPHLRIALLLMSREHLRYQRYPGAKRPLGYLMVAGSGYGLVSLSETLRSACEHGMSRSSAARRF